MYAWSVLTDELSFPLIAHLSFPDLFLSTFRRRLRNPEVFAIRVAVRVATVDKDNGLVFQQDDIGGIRKAIEPAARIKFRGKP